MNKLKMETHDQTESNIVKIANIFPNVISEKLNSNGEITKTINFELLKQELLPETLTGEEVYEFTWVGKKDAVVEANKSTQKILRPFQEESKYWDGTKNLYIEGDNLEILKLLQESYLDKIKMIYIDPPYNTGHDFIYPDSYVMDDDEFYNAIGYFNEDGSINYSRENVETSGKYHSDWCSLIYSRLTVAKNLLAKDGIIFVSSADNELDNLIKIGKEIFGDNNFIGCLPRVSKKAGKTTDSIARNHDYLVLFSKTSDPLFYQPSHTDEGFKFSDEHENERGKYKLNQTLDYDSLQYSESLDYLITIDGKIYYPGQSYDNYLKRKSGEHSRADWAWRWSKELFDFGYKNDFIVLKKYAGHARIYTKTYQKAAIKKSGNTYSIIPIDRTKPISSLEFTKNKYSNDNSKKDILQLFKNSIFDYPKPVSLLYFLSQYTTKNDDIILDFFSGSSTTAQAIMQLNADDNGHRQFIMVQLPEETDEKSEAFKAGYKNICEIGKERIRRAGEKIKSESPMTTQDLDVGFRVLKLDDSNMTDVYYGAEEYDQQMIAGLVSNIKPDRTDLDLLFGCLVDWGLPLSLPYTSEEIDSCTIHNYNDGDLIACFDEKVPESVIREIAKIKPLRVVFRDSSFSDSASRINVEEIFKLLSPASSVKVI